MRQIVTIFYIVLASILYGGTVIQTDWSGGDGVSGPVTDWQESFYMGHEADYSSNPGYLFLVSENAKHVVSSLFDGAWSVNAADVDGDGDMDVLGAGKLADQIAWWENLDGVGTSWQKNWIAVYFNGASSVYAVDIDNDSDMDVLGAGCNIDQIMLWENTNGLGSLWTQHAVDESYHGARSVYAADMDGDQDYDVLGASSEKNDISWWENVNGTGSEWTHHAIDEDCYNAQSVSASDLDGDGDADVLGAKWAEGNVYWWENNNGLGTSWIEHCIDSDFEQASEVHGVDIDSDGDLDILGAARQSNEVTWWENTNGSGSDWSEHLICDNLDYAYTVSASDLDGDGDMDVVGGGYEADEVRWWENATGSGAVWIEHLLDSDIDGPVSVYAEDLNCDGICDILGALGNSDQIVLWTLFNYPYTGYVQSSILDLQEHPEWLAVDWNGVTPRNSEMVFQFRTSGNPDNMGYWTDYINTPCSICDIVDDGDYLFQYRVRFFSDNELFTPVLEDFLVSWDPDGIEDEATQEYSLNGIFPSPATAPPSLFFTVPEQIQVYFSIYDCSGRLVESLSGEFEEGQHSITVSPPSPGVYFAKVKAGTFEDVCKFILVE